MLKLFPFLSWWPQVSGSSLRSDLFAGLTNAVVVLPQGVAFAFIAGLPPIYGLYSAMIIPVIAGFYGSSWHLITGPATAVSLVIFSTLKPLAQPFSEQFIELTLLLTFMVGAIQWLLGVVRLGTLVNFVSHSVIVGFTSGAAILIAFSQLRHITGINGTGSKHIVDVMISHITDFADFNFITLSLAITTILISVALQWVWPKLPHLLIAMLGGSLLGFVLDDTQEVVSYVGTIPAGLPPFVIPNFSFGTIQLLAPKALALAMLGLIEAVAIGKSIAAKSGQKIDGNQEFIGQGLSNMIGSFFSSFVSTGSFARSAINYESGAKTPISPLIAALSLVAIVLLAADYAAYLPMPVMGGIIFIVAYRLIDFYHIKKILKASWQETTVMVITFLSTLFLQLEYAIYFGVIFSLIFFLQRTAHPLIVAVAPDPSHIRRKFTNINRIALDECPQLKVVRIDGSLFYGAVDHVLSYLRELREQGEEKVLIMAGGINIIDVSGAEMLVNESKRWKESGGRLYISSLRIGAREFLQKGGYYEEIGSEDIFESKDIAIKSIYDQLDRSVCNQCQVRIFRECQKL